jgi:hypothetical protein
LAFAQKHDANRCHQHQDAHDLKWQIVIPKECRADIPNIVDCRAWQWRKSLVRNRKVTDHRKNLTQQD